MIIILEIIQKFVNGFFNVSKNFSVLFAVFFFFLHEHWYFYIFKAPTYIRNDCLLLKKNLNVNCFNERFWKWLSSRTLLSKCMAINFVVNKCKSLKKIKYFTFLFYLLYKEFLKGQLFKRKKITSLAFSYRTFFNFHVL